MAAHVPAAIAAMLQSVGVTKIPKSGKFRWRLLNGELLSKGATRGRIAAAFHELQQAGLLVDDRHYSKPKGSST